MPAGDYTFHTIRSFVDTEGNKKIIIHIFLVEEHTEFLVEGLSDLVRGLEAHRSHIVDFGQESFDHNQITIQLDSLLKHLRKGEKAIPIPNSLLDVLVYWCSYIHISNESGKISNAVQLAGNFSDYPDLGGYVAAHERSRREFKVDEGIFKMTLLSRLLDNGYIKLSASQINILIEHIIQENEYVDKCWRERDRRDNNYEQHKAMMLVKNNHSSVLCTLHPILTVDQMERTWHMHDDPAKIHIIKKWLESDLPPIEMLQFLRRKISELSENMGTAPDDRKKRMGLYALGQRINDHISKRRIAPPARDKQEFPKRRKELIF